MSFEDKITDSQFVRIVILNYNESLLTVSLVKQLKEQSFTHFEIVVVDNCSKIEEIEVLKNNLEKDIIVIFSEKNIGYSGGNNLGLKYPGKKADYFLVLNNDLIIEDKFFIEKILQGMLNYKNKGVVASSPLIDTISTGIPLENQIQIRKILNKWETFMINIPLFKPITNGKIAKKFLYKEKMPYEGKKILCDTINGAAFMIENNFLLENNYLDGGTFLYYEEIILGKQILNAGKRCLLNATTKVIHLQGMSTKNSGKKISPIMERYKYKSSLYYLKKYEKLGTVGSFLYVFLNEMIIFFKLILSKR